MKTTGTALGTLMATMAATPALAADTHAVYNSGILVLLFLGFCALVVMAQIIPSIVLLAGMVKEALHAAKAGKEVANG